MPVYEIGAPVYSFILETQGVVGLAIGQRLAQRYPRKSTYVVERHGRAGEETRQVNFNGSITLTLSDLLISSRNSEVIHAGLCILKCNRLSNAIIHRSSLPKGQSQNEIMRSRSRSIV